MSEKIIVDLSCVDTPDHLGIIFPCSSGVEYVTQAGGTCCSHPRMEGIYVPLNGGGPEESAPFYDHGPCEYESGHMDKVNDLIDAVGYSEVLEAVDPSDHPLPSPVRVMEAWIPVKVRNDAKGYSCAPLENLKGRHGILVYVNSD